MNISIGLDIAIVMSSIIDENQARGDAHAGSMNNVVEIFYV